MRRDDSCEIHGWTEHIVQDDCYCLETDEAGYTFLDEYDWCENCLDVNPVCVKCTEEETRREHHETDTR
jgi:hypothetical protein